MRGLIITLFLLLGGTLLSQDYPLFSQHVNLQGLINPAYNGMRESYSALVVSRNQWGGSVKTHALNAHAPLPVKGLGLGVVIMQDNYGLSSNLKSSGAFSYRLHITKDIVFSSGIQLGLVREQLDNASNTSGMNDQVLNSAYGEVSNRISAGFGFYVSAPSFFAGLSMPEIIPSSTGPLVGDEFKKEVPLLLYGGGIFSVNDDLVLKPSIYAQATLTSSTFLEFGLFAYYKQYGSVGITARTNPFSSLVFSTEIKLVEYFYLGYSYDQFLSSDGGMKKGTHEISLKYDLPVSRVLTKPAGSIRFF